MIITNHHPVMELTAKVVKEALAEMAASPEFPRIADGVRLTIEFAGTSKKFVKVARLNDGIITNGK